MTNLPLKLIVKIGGIEKELSASVPLLVIGSSNTADISLDWLSPTHATLININGVWRIKPEKGSDVSLNGEPITAPERIAIGDVVKIGDYPLTISSDTPTFPIEKTSTQPSAKSPSIPPAPTSDLILPMPYARWRQPDLEGRITYLTNGIPVSESIFLLRAPLRGIRRLFRFILRRPPLEPRVFHEGQLEMASGLIQDFRINSTLISAQCRTGDYVSLWGKIDTNVLAVKHGYNYTIRTPITIRR